MKVTLLSFFLGLALLSGCTDAPGDSSAGTTPPPAHAAKGPHGGALAEIGDHVAHLEVLHDDATGTLTGYLMDGDMKPLTISEAPVLNLKTPEGPRQVVATAGKEAGQWLFADLALKSEPEGARFRLSVNGVVYTPDMPHDEDDH